MAFQQGPPSQPQPGPLPRHDSPPPKKANTGLILIIGAVTVLMAAGATAVFAVFGTNTADVVTATASTAAPTQPRQAALTDLGTTTSPAPSDASDPACDMPEVANVLYWVEQSYAKGALDLTGTVEPDRTEAVVWLLALGRVEDAAQLDLYKATVKAKDNLQGFLDSPAGSKAALGWAYGMRVSMAHLAQSCGIEAAYTFADSIA